MMAKGTGHTYRTWSRRLANSRGSDAPVSVTVAAAPGRPRRPGTSGDTFARAAFVQAPRL